MVRAGAIIVVLGTIATFAGCAPDDDREGWDQVPTNPVYAQCTRGSQCDASDCWAVTVEYEEASFSQALCTYSCAADDDCDFGGRCYAVGDSPPLCYQPCYEDIDCRTNFRCVGIDEEVQRICLPG
jgi:hypothetical protein